jgi:glycosyltransferase involved in cell wall biosynthesis
MLNNEKEKRVTFIIPSINRPTLTRTVQSLLNQTNENWNCIIIFDGVEGITFDDSRIKVIKSDKVGLVGPNNGQSGLVRNIGIKDCQTEWIAFLDDDDTVSPDYVKTLFEKYENYDFVVWRMIYPNGFVLPPPNSNDLVFARVGISFCYKNKFDDFYFDKNRDGEDFDFLMKLKSKTNNYIITPEIFYKVRH